MLIRYDEMAEETLKKLLGNKNLTIGLDVAKGKDKSVEVTYCIRNGCDIIKTDTISFPSDSVEK